MVATTLARSSWYTAETECEPTREERQGVPGDSGVSQQFSNSWLGLFEDRGTVSCAQRGDGG